MKEQTTYRDELDKTMKILFRSLDQTEKEYGLKSRELAKQFLEFGAIELVKTLTRGPDEDTKICHQILVTENGVPLRHTALASYLFQYPDLTEPRLDKLERTMMGQNEIFRSIDIKRFGEIIPSALHLAAYFEVGGRHKASQILTESVLKYCRMRLDPGDPLTVRVLNALAVLYLKQGKLVEAEETLKEALDACERFSDAMEAHGPAVLINLSACSMGRGEHETAQDYLMHAHKIAAGSTGKRDDGYMLEVLVHLAGLYDAESMNDDKKKVLVGIKRVTVQALKSDPWFSVTYVSPPAEEWDSDIFIEFISNLDTVVQEGDGNQSLGILKVYFDLMRTKPVPRALGHKDNFPDFLLPD